MYPQAIQNETGAIQIVPDYAFAYATLGLILKKKGDISGARKAWMKAASLDKRFKQKLRELPPPQSNE